MTNGKREKTRDVYIKLKEDKFRQGFTYRSVMIVLKCTELRFPNYNYIYLEMQVVQAFLSFTTV